MKHSIKLNKIFIGGLNMSGKSLLLQLLDGHPKIVIYPFHKFGISNDIENFISYFTEKSKTGYNNVYKQDDFCFFRIFEKNMNIDFTISVEELLTYLFRLDNSLPNLLAASNKKSFTLNITDNHTEHFELDFSLNDFINEIYSFNTLLKNIKVSLEELENIIFLSYIKSVKQYKEKDLKNITFAFWLYNGNSHYKNIIKYFEDYKIILVKRNFLNRLYAKVMRNFRNTKQKKNIKNIKNIINNLIYASHFQIKVDEDNYSNKIFNNLIGEKIKIIEFSALVSQPEKVMRDISGFLKIDYISSMIKPSILSKEINYYKINSISEIDTIEKNLDAKAIKKIKFYLKNKFFRYLFVILLRIESRINFFFKT